jgi:hypothetical protein
MHEGRRQGVWPSRGSGFTRRGILAVLGGLGLAVPLEIAGAKRGKTQTARKDQRKGSAASSPKASPPQDVCAGQPSPCAFPGFPPPDACPFPIKLEFFGKTHVRELPGGRLIINSPAQNVIVTNLDDPSKQVTLNTTGSGHLSFGPNGEQLWVVTGRNLLYDPIVEPHLALTKGRFTFVLPADGSIPPLEPRAGKGNVTDVCTLVA